MSTTCSDIALADVAGPIKDMLDKLSGEDGADWLEAVKFTLRVQPHLIIMKLKELVRAKTWKKYTIGGYTKEQLLERFKSRMYGSGTSTHGVGIVTSDWDCSIAGSDENTFPIEKKEAVEFVKGRLSDLFDFWYNMETRTFLDEEFLTRRGLQFCRPCDAFYLRLKYINQPIGERVCVGMKPVIAPNADPRIFALCHNRQTGASVGLGLGSYYADSECKWPPDSVWVFRRTPKL